MPERTYIELMEQQRLLLLTALGATASGRPLTAREETGVEQALAQLTRQADHVAADRMRQPNLAEFCDLLLNPTPRDGRRHPRAAVGAGRRLPRPRLAVPGHDQRQP